MKNTFTFLCLVSFFSAACAQTADTIPNASFENWVNIGGWFDNPAGWSTNNAQVTVTEVLKSDSAYSGKYAMELRNAGAAFSPIAWCNFRIQHHPVSLDGYMQDQVIPATADSAIIHVRIFYHHQLIDSGYQIILGGINPNYIPFSVPITQSFPYADSAEIRITGGVLSGSVLILDDLSFSFANTVADYKSQTLFIVSPNPADQYLNIPASSVTTAIYNLLGQKMYSYHNSQTANDKLQMDISTFPNGIYFLRTQFENEMKEGKFVVEH